MDARLAVLEPAAELRIAPELVQLFVESYLRLYGRMLGLAERLLRSREDAQDAVSDAVESLWRRWPSLTPDQRSDRYILGAVTYSALARRRANKRFVSLDDAEGELESRSVAAELAPTRGETVGDLIDLAMAGMPPRRRAGFGRAGLRIDNVRPARLPAPKGDATS